MTEELVLTPFKKFFNLNEVEENSIENIEKEIIKCERFEVSERCSYPRLSDAYAT